MPKILQLEDFEAFRDARHVYPEVVTERVLQRLKSLYEEKHLETFLREILTQPYSTPHGPTELADILCTTRIRGQSQLVAFINKGKSFQRVTDKHVAHQFIKATSIPLLNVIAFVAVGDIQDSAIRCLAQEAQNAGCDCLITSRLELSRLLIAYGKICPRDGRLLEQHQCKCGFVYDREVLFSELKLKAGRRADNIEAAIKEGRVVRGELVNEKQPYVLAFVYFPRLGTYVPIFFLIDTGADMTVINPLDAIRAGVNIEKLGPAKEALSFGGGFHAFSESAFVSFIQEDGVILSYQTEVLIPEQVDTTIRIPSILGLDIISRMTLHIEISAFLIARGGSDTTSQ